MKELNIIYEDNHVIVVEKPVNIPSQQDKTGDVDMLTLIKKYLKEKYNKPGDVYLGLVHRLDRPVRRNNGICKNFKSSIKVERKYKK